MGISKDNEQIKKQTELMKVIGDYFGRKVNKFTISQPLFNKSEATIKVSFAPK